MRFNRMRRCLFLLAGLLFGNALCAAADTLDEYVSLATGEFSSSAQAADDPNYDAITWHIAEIKSRASENLRWLYTESRMDGEDAPYMQRVSAIEQQPDGSLVARRFRLANAKEIVGAHQARRLLDELTDEQLIELVGCETVIVRAGADRFEGATTGKRCPNLYKGARYALSQSALTRNGMLNWDRGFNEEGELVWGPAAGGYQFTRSDVVSEATCNDPVRLLVFGEISDRKRFIEYITAIAESGLYEKYGGHYEALTPAVDVLEGDPPSTRGVVIARFGCLESVQAFWNSPEYARIKPIRDGIADFEVLVLPAPQR